jgi:hypothetical protein
MLTAFLVSYCHYKYGVWQYHPFVQYRIEIDASLLVFSYNWIKI